MNYPCDKIDLDRGMYSVPGLSFSQVLARQDPDDAYVNTPLEGLDPYQRQLKRFDIKVRGAGSDTVEKFFSSARTAVLFPEFVRRSVRAGMEQDDTLRSITATVTHVGRPDYASLSSRSSGDADGTGISALDGPVPLHRQGRELVTSYNAVRCQKLDLFGVILRRIGAHIARMQLEDAIDVLIHGNRDDPAATEKTGSLDGYVLSGFWNGLAPYSMDTVLAGARASMELLRTDGAWNPALRPGTHADGMAFAPLKVKLLTTSAMPAGTLIGLDSSCALEMIRHGGVDVDHDALIDRRFERTAVTATAGFAKIFPDAVKVLETGRG